MNKIQGLFAGALIALTLTGCKTVLPNPDSTDATLVLAPFTADSASKTSGAWAFEYVLNHNENNTIRISPTREKGNFAVRTGLAEGEYTITGIKAVTTVTGGHLSAVGESTVRTLDPESRVAFEVSAGEITMIPASLDFQTVRTNNTSSIYNNIRPLSTEEVAELRAEIPTLDGYDKWNPNI